MVLLRVEPESRRVRDVPAGLGLRTKRKEYLAHGATRDLYRVEGTCPDCGRRHVNDYVSADDYIEVRCRQCRRRLYT